MPLATRPWATMRWLVIAPHADDETLGTGALIAQTTAWGTLAGIAFLTDGCASHPPGTPHIRSVRRREAGHAIRRLGAGAVPVHFINWRDANPHAQGDPAFTRDAALLAARLCDMRVDAIAVTAEGEAHCDHEAAFLLARAAVRQARRPVRLFQYHVWSEPGPRPRRILRTAPIQAGRRRHALAAHRSQLTLAYGAGFRLSPTMRRMTAVDHLYLYRDIL